MQSTEPEGRKYTVYKETNETIRHDTIDSDLVQNVTETQVKIASFRDNIFATLTTQFVTAVRKNVASLME